MLQSIQLLVPKLSTFDHHFLICIYTHSGDPKTKEKKKILVKKPTGGVRCGDDDCDMWIIRDDDCKVLVVSLTIEIELRTEESGLR